MGSEMCIRDRAASRRVCAHGGAIAHATKDGDSDSIEGGPGRATRGSVAFERCCVHIEYSVYPLHLCSHYSNNNLRVYCLTSQAREAEAHT